MTHRHQSIVIGGGVIGLSIAWNMSRQGCRVTLLERDQVGRATSWAGAGILPPANLAKATDPMDQLRGLSHELFPQWASDLQDLTNLDCGLRRCGGWYLADTPGERAAMLGMTGYWDQLGIQCEPVSREDLSRREPALSDWAARQGTASAWWVPDEYQLRSPRYLQALHQACLGAGVEIEEGTDVIDVRDTGEAAEVLVRDRWRSADSVVLCCGAWFSRDRIVVAVGTKRDPDPRADAVAQDADPIVQASDQCRSALPGLPRRWSHPGRDLVRRKPVSNWRPPMPCFNRFTRLRSRSFHR